MSDTPKPPVAPTPEVIEKAEHRFFFYKDGFRILLVVVPVMTACLVALTFAVITALSRTPEPRYFAVEQGKLIEMAPVNRPYVKPGDMNQWLARAITDIYMLDFQHYRQRIEHNAQYFTPGGFAQYRDSLEQSGRMKTIIDGWFVAAAVVESAPIIIEEGVLPDGRYHWRFRLPIKVDYISKTHRIPTQRLMLTVTVVRVNSWENPFAIGISQIIERNA
jgi:intracellular multiplication protein IcmL